MQRSVRLSLSLTGAAALALASTPIQPVAAQEEDGSAADLGMMEINLKDAVRFNWGFQGALQGAGIAIGKCPPNPLQSRWLFISSTSSLLA